MPKPSAGHISASVFVGGRSLTRDRFQISLLILSETIGFLMTSVGMEVNQFAKIRLIFEVTEAVVQRCSVKKRVLKIFTKFTGKHLCFPVNVAKFLTRLFL